LVGKKRKNAREKTSRSHQGTKKGITIFALREGGGLSEEGVLGGFSAKSTYKVGTSGKEKRNLLTPVEACKKAERDIQRSGLSKRYITLLFSQKGLLERKKRNSMLR